MSKIPDKPGWWWWQYDHQYDAQFCKYVNENLETTVTRNDGVEVFIKVENMEGIWLGPCHKPGESFTVEEIKKYSEYLQPWESIHTILSHKTRGIKAFTERNGK